MTGYEHHIVQQNKGKDSLPGGPASSDCGVRLNLAILHHRLCM